MNQTLYLVSCVAKKGSKPAEARDLYLSPLFKKMRAYTERHGDGWRILSAEHGLLNPWTVTKPYDTTLSKMPIAERRAWAADVLRPILEWIEQGAVSKVVILAGARYREFIEGPLRKVVQVEVPMEGLQIGQQLSWLTRELAKPRDTSDYITGPWWKPGPRPYDMNGSERFVVVARALDDPERKPRKKGNETKWRTTMGKGTDAKWRSGLLRMFKARPGITFNAALVHLADVTADMGEGKAPGRALWDLVEAGKLAHSTKAPIRFRLSRPQDKRPTTMAKRSPKGTATAHTFMPTANGGVFPVTITATYTDHLPGVTITGISAARVREVAEIVRSACAVHGFDLLRKRLVVDVEAVDDKTWEKPGRVDAYAMALPIALAVIGAGGYGGKGYKAGLRNAIPFGELALDGRCGTPRGGLAVAQNVSAAIGDMWLIPGVMGPTFDLAQAVQSVAFTHDEKYKPDPKTRKHFTAPKDESGPMAMFVVETYGGTGAARMAKEFLKQSTLTVQERNAAARIHSVAGLDREGRTQPPFRAPHHSVSLAGLVGGARGPGEALLASYGVLLLDDYNEFSMSAAQGILHKGALQNVRVLVVGIHCTDETSDRKLALLRQKHLPWDGVYDVDDVAKRAWDKRN